MITGVLIQPFFKLQWGEVMLHNYTEGAQPENLIQNLSLKLNKEDSAPRLTFEITPSPTGFQAYQKLMAESLTSPIVATFGYLNGSQISNVFKFAGNKLTTGHRPKLQITAVSAVKGAWTDNKISYTMSEPIALEALPQFVQGKCGEGCKNLTFQFEGKAKEIAGKVQWQGSEMQVTPHVIITRAMRESGIETKVGRTALLPNGSLVFSMAPGYEPDKEEREDNVVVKPALPTALTRNIFIVGPGLIENFSRSQSFNTGSNSTANAVSATSPEQSQVRSNAVPQPQNAGPQTETVESRNLVGGVSGQNNPGSQGTATTPDPAGTQTEARTAKAKLPTAECSLRVLMVPYMCGIQPGDILAVPSLKGPGEFIEDWEVKSVTYKQSTSGGVDVTLSGQRPYIGQIPILSDKALSEVRDAIAGLTTPDAWANFYWSGGRS